MPDEQQTYYLVTDEQLSALAGDAADQAVAGLSETVGTQYETLAGLVGQTTDAVTSMGSLTGQAVTLTDEQYEELTQLMSAQLHGSLYVFAVLCFIAGIYGITQVVRHWRRD